MIEFVYQTLAKIGYTHPLHPLVIHLTMGLVMGGFVFNLAARFFKRRALAETARYCLALALISIIPTILTGYLDWRHTLAGASLTPIKMKLLLTMLLLIALPAAVYLGQKTKAWSAKLMAASTICLLIAMGLGYFGAELVYGKKDTGTEIKDDLVRKGAALFSKRCAFCHSADTAEVKTGPGLKGLYKMEKLPASGSPVTDANILGQLKNPLAMMPPFVDLDQEKIDALLAYLKTL